MTSLERGLTLALIGLVVALYGFYRYHRSTRDKHAKLLEKLTYKRILRGPPPEGEPTVDEMLMLVCRDILVLAEDVRERAYYPPHDVAKRMLSQAEILRPYIEDFKKMGWHQMDAFVRNAQLRLDDNGKYYISLSETRGCKPVSILCEAAVVVSHYPYEETIESDIKTDLALLWKPDE